MGSSPKSPPPPDTAGAARAEAAGNKEVAQITAGYNRPTQIDPYGQTTWTFKGTGPASGPTPAQRAAVTNLEAQIKALQSKPIGGGKPNDRRIEQQARDRQLAQLNSQLTSARAAVTSSGGARGTPDNPRPGDWVQTTSLNPMQQAILEAEQGNDLALQRLASQGVGIAQDVLGNQFNPQGLPQLKGLSGIGASQYGIPTANFGGIAAPQFQKSAQGVPTYTGPTGAMPSYAGPGGNVPQATSLGGAVPTYRGPQGSMPQFQGGTGRISGITGPSGAMPQFQGNTGSMAGITGPTGSQPQFGADTVGMSANRLNNMNRLGESSNEFSAERQSVQDAMYQQLTRFNQQRFGQEEEAERTRLANMGFTQGTAAYDNALQEFRRSKDEAYQGSQLAAILAGGSEQSRLRADQLAARQSNIGLGEAQFGQDQARYQQGLTERQAQFGAGMSLRDQQTQEQLARFQTGLAGRQQTQQEALDRFGAGMTGRDQTLEEQMAQFQTGLAGRQQFQQEALDRFGAGMAGRELQGQEALTQFQTGMAGRGQQQAELESLFGRQMDSRQQGVNEALTRFQTGMSGREQQLAEAAQRQQALAQNYGLGLDERQTAFNANLASQGFMMDRTQAQLGADTNRYQMGLGERQAQQQSQMNQQNLAAQQRQQLFQEQAYARSLPLNEVTALMSGSGVSMPQFAGFQAMQPWQGPQLLDAEMGRYNAQLGATNAANAGRGQTTALIGGLAMAGATAF